jgi:hypothetical protein
MSKRSAAKASFSTKANRIVGGFEFQQAEADLLDRQLSRRNRPDSKVLFGELAKLIWNGPGWSQYD